MTPDQVPIARVADFNPPTPRTFAEGDDEIAFVPMAAVSDDGTMRVHEHRPAHAISNGYSYFQSGDVLVAKITPCFENNKIVLANINRTHGFGSTEFHVIRPHIGVLDARYLAYFLRQDAIREAGQKRMTGSAGQRRVPRQFLEQLQIPLPPLDEQRRIAAILDQADALRRKRREALEQLDELKQSLLEEAVKSANGELKAINLGSCVDEFRYGTSAKATGTGFPVLRIPNVVGSAITTDDLKHVPLNSKEAERLRLRNDDLLFVRTNGNREYVGRSAVVTPELGKYMGLAPADFVYASYLIRARLRLENVDATYLQAYLSGPSGRKAILERAKTSAGQFNINIESLSSIPVELPLVERQRRFSEKSREIDRVMALYRGHLNNLDGFFASLQYRAFRGEL